MPLLTSNINTVQKLKIFLNEMYTFQTRLVQFTDQKKLKLYIKARIELSANESTKKY